MLLNMPSLLQFFAVFSVVAFCTQANPIHYSEYERPNFYDLFHVEPQVSKLPAADGNLNIFALPVGQGDCTVIQCPKGDITIIDLGSRKSTGFDQQDLINYLNGQNVEKIFLTHSDLDHINLLIPFLNSLKAQGKAFPPVYHSCPWTRYGVNIAGLKTIQIKSCCPCKTIQICGNDVALEIKASGYNNCPDDESPNGDSIVMRLKYKANTVFLPGDFEGGVNFINNFLKCAGTIKSDVLRLSHHGADNGKANTNSFLNAIDPISVFSSSGLPSKYGHPRCSLYNRFHAAGIQQLFQHDYTCYNGCSKSYETFTTKDIIYTTTIANFKTKTYENYVIGYDLPTKANQKITVAITKV